MRQPELRADCYINYGQRSKLIGFIVLAIFSMIVILQNTGEVTGRLLFVTVTMPIAVAILLVMCGGFVIGVLVSLIFLKKGKLTAQEKPPEGN